MTTWLILLVSCLLLTLIGLIIGLLMTSIKHDNQIAEESIIQFDL